MLKCNNITGKIMFNQSSLSNNFMKLSYLNLDFVNIKELHEVRECYPIPLPVIAREDGDIFLVKPICSKSLWIKEGSMESLIESDKEKEDYIKVNSDTFNKQFTQICENYYVKKPQPYPYLKLTVPCVFSNKDGELSRAMPNDYIVMTGAQLRSFQEKDFERLFTQDKDLTKKMNTKLIPKRQSTTELSP
jgi:hypothetical protein